MLATVEYEHDPEYAEYLKRVDTAAAPRQQQHHTATSATGSGRFTPS